MLFPHTHASTRYPTNALENKNVPTSQKPALKKVSKTANQMEKILMFTAKISQSNYRQGLKVVSVKEKEPLLRENSKDPTAGTTTTVEEVEE